MGAVENVREFSEFVKKFNDIELNRRILALENEVLDLSREKRRAEEKVEELERALKLNKELVFRAPFYYLDGDATPYCPGCWEARKTAIHLHRARRPLPAGDVMYCPTCKNDYRNRGVAV
jgi:predicted RNase H-like nuclease (RuvC/YqgF family)